MEPYQNKTLKGFLTLAVILLISTVSFGLLASMQYLVPGFWRDVFSFEKIRPLHVSSAVFWILTAAMGVVLTFVQEHTRQPLRFPKLLRLQFYLFGLTILAILVSYFMGIFSGREYWEYSPLFAVPVILSWILFIINLFGSVRNFKKQPVYVWMWLTGVCFFLFTYLEVNAWVIPWFQNRVTHDMTIQWKAYGSIVGAWNMLIYGSSIYLMDKISGNWKYSYSKIGFALYFLGLFNGMFNWGHHIYTLPTHHYIQYIAYGVSMTELILFVRIIYLWRSSLSTYQKLKNNLSYKFIMAADIWVFITLALAIPMSIPAINIYMHGTFVIVGHTMGATIGINTMLLLAFLHHIIGQQNESATFGKTTIWGYRLVMIALPIFFLVLLTAGFLKGFWQLEADPIPFATMMFQLRPYLIVFVGAGLGLFIGFLMITLPLLRKLLFVADAAKEDSLKSIIK